MCNNFCVCSKISKHAHTYENIEYFYPNLVALTRILALDQQASSVYGSGRELRWHRSFEISKFTISKREHGI